MMSSHAKRGSSEDVRSPSPTSRTEDIRTQLYYSLQKEGVIDKLKSEMRHRLIMELTAKRALQKPPQLAKGSRSLAMRAGDSLVADYLSRRKLEYTLSVFVPEAGLSKEKLLSNNELLDLLHINPYSNFYKSLLVALKSQDGFLWVFLRQLAERSASAQNEIASQTENSGGISGASLPLSERLSRIDTLYAEARGMEAAAGVAAFEERLARYQSEVEERLRRGLAAEQERFRAGELARMRQEERERQRLEGAAWRRQMEAEHAERLCAVQEREREAAERWRRQQEAWDREAAARRDALLAEAENQRARERTGRREQEAAEKEQRVRQERLRATEEGLRQREQLLKEREATMEGRLAEERATIRLAEERKVMTKWREVEASEEKLKQELLLLEKEKDNTRHLKEEVLKRQALFDEMEVRDYSCVKQENAALQEEIEALKTRITKITQEADRLNATQRRESNQVGDLQRTVDRLHEDLKREKSLQHGLEQSMQQSLQKEMTAHNQLLQRYEAQSLQVKELQQEVEDLRDQLQQTEYALNCEVNRRPLPTGLTPRTPRGEITSSRFGDAEECVAGPLSGRSLATPRWAKFDGGAHVGTGLGVVEDMEDIVAETRHRLQLLDQETENLQGAYRSFQHRLANPVYGDSKPFGDVAWSSKIQGGSAEDLGAFQGRHVTEPFSKSPPRRQILLEDLKIDREGPRVAKSAGLKFESSFLDHVSHGFDDAPHSPAVNFDLPADTSHDVGSTGDQFGPVASGEALEATTGPSLDETWRSGADSEAEASEAEWEAQRQRRAEEKAQREQEEWETQQRELAQLRQSSPTPLINEEEKEEMKEEKGNEETQKNKKKEEEEELAIDPMMQKYMEMVRQQKQAAAASPAKEEELPEFDLGDEDPPSVDVRSAAKSDESRSDFW